jgi:hypothetical protein
MRRFRIRHCTTLFYARSRTIEFMVRDKYEVESVAQKWKTDEDDDSDRATAPSPARAVGPSTSPSTSRERHELVLSDRVLQLREPTWTPSPERSARAQRSSSSAITSPGMQGTGAHSPFLLLPFQR